MDLPIRIAAAMSRLTPGWRSVPGIVAVSGGADSVALLRLLTPPLRFGEGVGGWGVANLIVAHVNHMLRGDESDADEQFVIELAGNLGLPIRTARVPVPSGNLEGEARKSRYAFFDRVAAETGAGWIATAHTLDDQAETVLHRLIRGTGIQGLRGIFASPPSPPAGEGLGVRGRILRPLLNIRRSELREYLASIQQPFREDSSNADPRFTRNRIRHDLIPLLETFNPRIAEVLNRLSQQAAEWHDKTEAETALLLERVERPRAGTVLVFDLERLAALSTPQRRAVLRMAWQREGWPEAGMTFPHWQRLAALGTHDFPGGVRSARHGQVFQLRGDSRRRSF
jgi:tRNA(Ile)-lysidine synthase